MADWLVRVGRWLGLGSSWRMDLSYWRVGDWLHLGFERKGVSLLIGWLEWLAC